QPGAGDEPPVTGQEFVQRLSRGAGSAVQGGHALGGLSGGGGAATPRYPVRRGPGAGGERGNGNPRGRSGRPGRAAGGAVAGGGGRGTGRVGMMGRMVATVGELPTAPGWGYEFKWDGVRAVVYLDAGKIRIASRNDRDVTASYPELRGLLDRLGRRRVVLDGE